jgi:hypothetical protein
LPITLSPLGPHLTKFLQKKGELSAAKKSAGLITIIEAIEETPPPASASKTPAAEDAVATEAALLKLQLPKLQWSKIQIWRAHFLILIKCF